MLQWEIHTDTQRQSLNWTVAAQRSPQRAKPWIADLFKARETAPEQPPQSPNLANLLMKYLSVQREKSRKYSQRWQQQHATDELKTIAAAVNYLSEHSISNLCLLYTSRPL